MKANYVGALTQLVDGLFVYFVVCFVDSDYPNLGDSIRSKIQSAVDNANDDDGSNEKKISLTPEAAEALTASFRERRNGNGSPAPAPVEFDPALGGGPSPSPNN